MQKYQNNVLTNSGQPLAGANVLVLNYPAGTPATIYSDNGVNIAANPLLTDFSGAFGFYAADGHYSLQISRFGVDTLTVSDILLNDDIPTDEGTGIPLTGAELQSVFQNGGWVQKSLSTIATFALSIFTILISSGAGSVARTILAWIQDQPVSVKNFGAKVDGATDDTNAVTLALAWLKLIGGGTLFFPPGICIVSNSNPSSTSWDTNCGIWVLANNIRLEGAGIGISIIRAAANSNSHVVCFGQRTNGTITVANCGISGIEIDGNRSNQNAIINSTDYHNAGIMVQSGCTNIRISDFYVHDAMWYGIGMQRDGLFSCSIRDGVIVNTGVDSIDWKNDSDNSYGNVIDNIYASNWGLLPVATTADPSAAFDLRSGITATNLVAQTPGQSAVAGIRLQNGTPGATPVQASKVDKYLVIGAGVSGSAGVRVISRNVDVLNGYSTGWDDGHSFSEPDCRYVNLYGYNNVTSGFRFWNDSSAGTLASTNQSFGLIARANATGVICDGSISETQFFGCDVRGNTTYGYDIRTGCSSIRLIGGSATGNTTANINDNGTSTIIQDVSGYKTYNVVSTTVAIDSTGTKSIAIPHGLPFTPNVSDVTWTTTRNTNVGDWSQGFIWTTSTDATNVNGQLRVLTASATGGAVVNVLATVNSKNR